VLADIARPVRPRATKGENMSIAAWTYEAAVHCPDCAFARFGAALETEDPWGDSYPTDIEGNPPWPVFGYDIAEFAYQCSEFGECRYHSPKCDGSRRLPVVCDTCLDVIWEE
jgi:hypothetical protein